MVAGRKKADGRFFDTWTWEKEGNKRTVEVRVHGGAKDAYFTAEDKELGIHVKSPTAPGVVAMLQKAFDERFDTHWELWVWVSVANHGDQEGVSHRAPTLRFDEVAIGRTADGQDVYADARLEWTTPDGVPRNTFDEWKDGVRQKPRVWYGKWKPNQYQRVSYGKPRPPFHDASGETVFERGKPELSLIPGTIENINAILRFEWELRCMAWRLREHFTQDKVEATLARIAKDGFLALPEPATRNT